MKILILLSIFLCLSGCAKVPDVDTNTPQPTETTEPFKLTPGTTVLIRLTKEQLDMAKDKLIDDKDIFIEWFEEEDFIGIEVYGDKFEDALNKLDEVIYGKETK